MAIHNYYKTYKTVAKFRLEVEGVPDVAYKLAEANKEGEWYYDPTDTFSADNIGMIIVTTTNSLRFKRRLYSPYVYKSWFTGSLGYFSSVADANSTIPLAVRFRGMKVYILNTVVTEYWYRDGTSDGELIPSAEILTVTNGPTTFGRQGILTTPSSTELKGKSISFTGNNGVVFTPTVASDSIDWAGDFSSLVGVSTGTFSARPIGVLGKSYYQTDQLEGLYLYDGARYSLLADDNTLVHAKFFGALTQYSSNAVGTSATVGQDAAAFRRYRLETGTDTTGFAQLRLSSNAAGFGTTGKIIFSARVTIPTLSDGTNRFIVRVGRPAGADGIGMFFKYSDNLSGGDWECITHNGTSGTIVDSGVPIVAGGIYDLIAVYDFTGTDNVKFYINNVQIGTQTTTTLPANFTGGYFGAVSIEKTLGTTNRTFSIEESIIKRII